LSETIYGVHPVVEALRARRRPIDRILVAAERQDARVRQVIDAAREAGVPVQRQPRVALDRLSGGGRHQGVVAVVGGMAYADPETTLGGLKGPALLVVLDGVEDPRNLGSTIRSAAAAGADALFLPERGAAGLTGVCVKASAGAAERLPVARIGNVVYFLKSLKEKGIWVVGLDAEGERGWTDFDLCQPVALVFGGEGRGLRRLARETCDIVLSIPLAHGVESLNLSVAAGIVLFEAVRQRRQGGVAGRPEPGPGSLS